MSREIELSEKTDIRSMIIIGVLSVVVPLLVAFLLFTPQKLDIGKDWVAFLPHLNGVVNTATSISLLMGFVFIKRQQITYHKVAMLISFFLGIIFLVSYVIYHSAADSTLYGDANGDKVLDASEAMQIGVWRIIYLVILISHIILAAIVVPFVLLALFFALSNKIERHKKVVRYTFPIWLYVSITGVIVYLLISPYYSH